MKHPCSTAFANTMQESYSHDLPMDVSNFIENKYGLEEQINVSP
jgi:hypothetical protein